MDQDGTEELILKEGLANGPFIYYAYRVYTAENTGSGYQAKAIEGSEVSMDLVIPHAGTGAVESGGITAAEWVMRIISV